MVLVGFAESTAKVAHRRQAKSLLPGAAPGTDATSQPDRTGPAAVLVDLNAEGDKLEPNLRLLSHEPPI
jgi:hypothetical protein